MNANLMALLTGIIFLLASIICLFWPKKIQEYVLKRSNKGVYKMNPFSKWMKTKNYIWVLKIIGVINFVVSIFVFYILLK